MTKEKKSPNPNRRNFLGTTLKSIPIAVVSTVGLSKAVQAIPQAPGSVDYLDELPSPKDYTPTFFTDEEYLFISSAVDLLIPEDDLGPGAVAAGVPEFIDRQMETPYGHGQLWYMQGPFNPEIMKEIPTLGYQLDMTPRQIYQSGIAACNAWCHEQYGKAFTELSDEQKHDAMTQLSEGKAAFADDAVPSSVFFEQLWGNTKEGFFADPMYGGNREMVGWKMVGFPGARGDYLDWAGRYDQSYPIPPVSITPRKG